jgi:NADH-quinone oxidoreductase subunit L
MTAFYMFRLTIVAFHGKPKTEIAHHSKENQLPIVLPLVVLSVLTIWFFYSPNPIDATAGWFHHRVVQPETAVPAAYQWDFLIPEGGGHAVALHADAGHAVAADQHAEVVSGETSGHHYQNKLQEEVHHFHYIAMILSLLIAGSGIALAFLIYQYKVISADKLEARFRKLHTFSLNKWYFDELYEKTVIGGTLLASKGLALFDNYIIDGIVNLSAAINRIAGQAIGIFDNVVIDGAVNLVASVTGYAGGMLKKLQTGRVQSYVVFALLGLLILFFVFI